MPGNPSRLLHRTRLEEEDLKIQAELYQLNQLPGHPLPKASDVDDTRMGKLLNKLYMMFVDEADKTGKPHRMPAAAFDVLAQHHSNTSINKAKKMLGIESIRRGGQWWWKFPRLAPSQAFAVSHKRLVKEYDPAADQLKLLNKPAAIELMAIMRDHNYEIQNRQAVGLMEQAGYKRSTTVTMKAALGIINGRKIAERVMWYWPNRDVQDWLEKKLSNGPVPHVQLAQLAWEENSWSYELIHWARKALPHIQLRMLGGVGHWVDMNHQGPGKVESVVEVDMTPVPDEPRHIIVDFTAELPEQVVHDLAPAPGKQDLPAMSSHTVKLPGGVKLEVFE